MKKQCCTVLLFIVSLTLYVGCTPEYYKLNQSGLRKVENNDFEGAFKDFDGAIKLNDRYWLAYLNRGSCYANRGENNKALDDFNRSILLRPKNPSAFDNRGLCKAALNDSLGAIADFRQALKLDSKFYIAYTHLGTFLANMDSCEQSVYYLTTALERKAFNDCISEQQVLEFKRKCEK